jgi:DNA (cytosine-5)-methyltransferase 1
VKFISLCSGIEAASAAWVPLGWEPLVYSEKAKFPSEVLAHLYPTVPNVGDMTAHDWSRYAGAADLVIGGTPCQAFSVAGLRKSLSDDRGNLALAFVEAVNAIQPRFVLYENVPGILNTKDNAFGCLLAALVGCDAALVPPSEFGWSDAGVVAGPERTAAWRCLDAQFFGLAQRRKRVFVVACPREGADPAQILFEPKGLRWHPPESLEAREEVAGPLGAGAPGSGWRDDLERSGAFIANALTSHASGQRNDPSMDTFIPDVARCLLGNGFDASEDGSRATLVAGPVMASDGGADDNDAIQGRLVAGTLRVASHGGDRPLIAIQSANRVRNRVQNGIGISEPGAPMYTLDSRSDHAICFDNPQPGDPAPPLAATGRTHVAYSVVPEHGQSADVMASEVDVAPTLTSEEAKRTNRGLRIAQASAVRRLMPVECERLQGFPLCLERVIIDASLDRRKNVVYVALRCLRWLGNALLVDAGKNAGDASYADPSSLSAQDDADALAVVCVRTGSEPKAVEIRSLGKSLWFASGVEASRWSHRATAPDVFAREVVAHAHSLVPEILHGGAASRPSIRLSITPTSGSWPAAMFGRESAVDASAAIDDSSETGTSTTSSPTPDSNALDSHVATSLSSVLETIASFIPARIGSESFCRVVVDIESEYTKLPDRDADGPRYEALGNSIAVPVLRWIGKRIEVVDGLR